MMKTIAGVVFAAGLSLAGCGGPESETNAPAKSSAGSMAPSKHVSTGVRCSNKDWQDIFWSDATHTVQVGTLTCSCFQLEDLEGVESNFITLAYEDTCDTQ
jgi:hypothetical protein